LLRKLEYLPLHPILSIEAQKPINMKLKYFHKQLILTVLSVFSFSVLTASSPAEHGEGEKYNPVPVILEHILDSHEWHLYTTKDEHGHEHHVSVPLPVILIDGGLKVFMSSTFHHDEHNHFLYSAEVDGKTYFIEKRDANGNVKGDNIYYIENGEKVYPLDFSITKNVLALIVGAVLIFFIVMKIAKHYKTNGAVAPKGVASFFEPIVLLVRDDIAKQNIDKHKYQKFMPFLLTLFFFIWFNNLLGLIPFIPGGANLTGNISVTLVLAVITLIVILINGNKHYWEHILWMPGVPAAVKIILTPIEVIGILTKPFALMVRLFANITAGHIVVLSLVSLVFIFKNMAMGAVSVPFTLFISVLELLVAFLQAYVFTMLSALFIGAAVEEAHH
jgi:F-type H+-transporting ATPase subunit a